MPEEQKFSEMPDEQLEKYMEGADANGIPREAIYTFMALADAFIETQRLADRNRDANGTPDYTGVLTGDRHGMELFYKFVQDEIFTLEWTREALQKKGPRAPVIAAFAMGMSVGTIWGRSSSGE